MNTEQEIINEAYRTALFDAFTAILRFLSVEDRKWLMPKLIRYAEECNKAMQR